MYPWFSDNSVHSHTVTSRVSVILASAVWQTKPRARTDALGRGVLGWGALRQAWEGLQQPWLGTSLAQAHEFVVVVVRSGRAHPGVWLCVPCSKQRVVQAHGTSLAQKPQLTLGCMEGVSALWSRCSCT